MRILKIVFIFLFFRGALYAQPLKVVNNQAIHFNITMAQDTVDFIIVDTNLDDYKPILLWCQGSLPIPLFIDFEEYGLTLTGGGITNFDISTIKKDYHLVVVSMPKTPLIANEKDINQAYFIFDKANPSQPTRDFQSADYLDNYEKRAIAVLDFLKKQAWVDTSKLVIAGHSQGCYVASKIALKYDDVTHIGLFGANPFGRISQFIMETKRNVDLNKITAEEAEKQIDDQYEFYRNTFDPELQEEYPWLVAWNSFAIPIIRDWLKIEKPIYLAYGSEDMASYLCDLVPLLFIEKQKTNLTTKRYLNLDHNFFEVENGKVNYEKEHWREVMNTFIEWTK